jgi:hypothetical protein
MDAIESKSIRFLLEVIDSNYKSDRSIEEPIPEKNFLSNTIKLAKSNGLYYIFIYKLKTLGIAVSSFEEENWNAELFNLEKYRKTIKLLHELANFHHINYSIIKSCNTVPHVPRDIDIFIRKDDRITIINALQAIGMNCIHSDVTETSLKGDYTKTDIYTEICYMGVEFIDEDFLIHSVIEDKVFDVNYRGLDNESSLLLLIIHSLFGHRSITLLDFMHINNVIKDTNLNLCRTYANQRGWGKVFDLVLDKLGSIRYDIYENKEFIEFPYIFDTAFLIKCINNIDGFDVSIFNYLFIYIAFFQDKIIYELRDTKFYNILKSNEISRNYINSLTSVTKRLRGDRKSCSSKKKVI